MKTTKILLISILALTLILCLAKVSEAAEMGTAFTYQGHLYDANDVANGLYDFQFALYDANSGGGQAGSDVNKPDVDVIDAYFTVELDFGSDVFDSNERWLEIGIRPGELEDPCTYATLVPRQEVTPTPYALYAKATGAVPVPLNLNSASSEPLIFASNSGGIGVRGSSSSTYGVYGSGIGANAHGIRGDSENQYGVLGFSNNSYGLYGQSANSYSGYFDGDAKVTGDLIVDSNVGIGTSNPSAKLTVNGAILRSSSTMHGTNASNHINLGTGSTTGEPGQNWSYATVGGGWSNDATGFSSTIAGGNDNTAGGYGTVGGGSNNEASSSAATVSGGRYNTASGYLATVPGGRDNTADGGYSFAAGRRAKANHDGSFVWADSADANFASTGNNQFLIRASGNVGIGTTSPTEILDVNGTVKATAFSGDGGGLTNLPATPDGDWTIDGSDMYSVVSGNVGIGTTSPNAKLDVNDGAVLFSGSIGGTPVSGAGKRLMWIPSKVAFRAGGVSGTEWNDLSIGIYSTAMGQNNTASGGWSTIGGGGNNTAGSAATVGGGLGNTANGSWSTVSGGLSNTASYSYATVSGGTNNTADGNDSTISGGNYSTASGICATIGGGYNNYALGHQSTVGGGIYNAAGAYSATVGGGSNNIADSNYATVGGGYSNYASGDYATVGGGIGNTADGNDSTIGGGYDNDASGDYATVGGGYDNDASGDYATVGGGYDNDASGDYATVGGGVWNNARYDYATVSGGGYNDANGSYSTICGGMLNIASNSHATIGGGWENTASGQYATVPGGLFNNAGGDYSFAAGRRAKSNHRGSFVWADSADVDFFSTGNDQFLIRASGGVGIGTTSPTEKLEVNGNLKVTGNIIGGLKTYDSGWFAVSTNTTYSKTHNLGTTKVLAVIYVAADSSGTHMSTPTTAPDEFIVVSQITTTTCVVRTNTWVARHWDGSSWVNSSYARIIMMALE